MNKKTLCREPLVDQAIWVSFRLVGVGVWMFLEGIGYTPY